jgi:HTH-like domain
VVNRALLVEIRRVHAAHRGRYGAPRVHATLRAEGHTATNASTVSGAHHGQPSPRLPLRRLAFSWCCSWRPLLDSISNGYKLSRTYPRRLWSGDSREGGQVARLTPDGMELVVGQTDTSVGIWGMKDHRRRLVLGGLGDPIFDVAISADGQRVAAGDSHGRVRVWNRTTGQLLTENTEGATRVMALAFDDREGTLCRKPAQAARLGVPEKHSRSNRWGRCQGRSDPAARKQARRR